MVNDIYRDRARAESFGDRADTYDQTRPSYPIELVHWLSRRGVGAAVDVGCGTGQVAALLEAAGWSVTGVEPDERMADIARSHGIDVVVAPFEQWAGARHSYDLVCSGTAWHWVDPRLGYDHAAELLRVGGRLAIFRNSYTYERDVADGIRAALRRFAPELLRGCIPLGTDGGDLVAAHARDIAARRDLFGNVGRRIFTHARAMAPREWIAELETHSPIAMLEDAARADLLRELARVAQSTGRKRVLIRHMTQCVAATRR